MGSTLNGVSCVAGPFCVTVGVGYNTKNTTLIYSWNGGGKPGDVAEVLNGTTWKATRPIAWPQGAANPQVTGVSCVTASYCVAVGYIDGIPPDRAAGGALGSASVARAVNRCTPGARLVRSVQRD